MHIDALTRALSERGHEIVMAGPVRQENRPLNAGARSGLKQFLPARLYECAEFSYSARGYVRLARLAAATTPDLIYERYNLHYFAGAWLSRRLKLPFILEVNAPLAEEREAHGNLALKTFARRHEADIWKAADKVLPVTETLADRIRAAGVADEKIEIIPNGVGREFLEPVEGAKIRERYGVEHKLVLGFTGFVRDWHGVDRAIHYLARAGRDDLHLLIVGDGPARAGLETLASELGVARHVTVTGVVQRAAMPEYVAAFDIALQPAVVDYASPLKLFEYMAMAKPVLAPDAPNILEILKDGENGLLFRGDGFDAALGVLVGDEHIRRALGAAARKTIARDDYTWAGNARRVERIAEDLTAQERQ